jgi:putative transposase
MNQITESSAVSLLTDAAGYDPIEDRLWANVRATIEAMFEEELSGFLGGNRYVRGGERAKGYRHEHRDLSTPRRCACPRARVEDEAGKVTEWRSKALPRYRRPTKKAEALIASVYLAGTNTRRVKRPSARTARSGPDPSFIPALSVFFLLLQ